MSEENTEDWIDERIRYNRYKELVLALASNSKQRDKLSLPERDKHATLCRFAFFLQKAEEEVWKRLIEEEKNQ